MTALVRHHTRWCLVATAALLVAAFALHDVSAQFRPPPGGGIHGNHGGGFSGVSGMGGGGVSGMPGHPQGGGFSGNHFSGGGASGTGAAGFQGHSGGVPGVGGGIGGGRIEYFCSRCNAKVSPSATRCPNCGAIFTGTTVMPGAGPSAGGNPPNQPGGFAPQNNNPGMNSPTRPASADNKPSWDSSSTPSSGSSDGKGSGLSAAVIVAASIVTLGLFALIAGIVVVMSNGKAPANKARGRRFHDDDY